MKMKDLYLEYLNSDEFANSIKEFTASLDRALYIDITSLDENKKEK